MPRKKGTENKRKKKPRLNRYEITYILLFAPRKSKVIIYANSQNIAMKEFWSRLDEYFHNLVSVSDITWMEAE